MADVNCDPIDSPGLDGPKMSKPPVEIVREYFPGASDDDAGYILWNHTGWPAFWDGEPEASLRQQLQELVEFTKANNYWPS